MYASIEIAWLWLRRNPPRLIYLVTSLVLTSATWVVLSSITSTISSGAKHESGSAIVVMATQKGRTLPISYITKIEALEGVADVAYMTFMPLICREPSTIATLNAWSIPSSRLNTIIGSNTPTDDTRSWEATEQSILVGSRLANECGWATGLTIEPLDAFSRRRVRLTIASVLPPTENGGSDHIAYAHYTYIDRMTLPQDRGTFRVARVYPDHGVNHAALASTIEEALAAEIEPVEAKPSAESESLMTRYGGVALLVRVVVSAMGISTVLLYLSSFAHAAAKRRPSIAVLFALGFSPRQVIRGTAVEIAALVFGGLMIGTCIGITLLRLLKPYTSIYFGSTTADFATYMIIAAGGCLLWTASALIQFLAISRVNPSDRNRP